MTTDREDHGTLVFEIGAPTLSPYMSIMPTLKSRLADNQRLCESLGCFEKHDLDLMETQRASVFAWIYKADAMYSTKGSVGIITSTADLVMSAHIYVQWRKTALDFSTILGIVSKRSDCKDPELVKARYEDVLKDLEEANGHYRSLGL